MLDVAVIGAGLVGLSIARACTEKQLSVAVADREIPTRGASIAAAGIIPLSTPRDSAAARSKLLASSSALYRRHAQDLFERTGIDVGYRDAGELEIALDDADRDLLARRMQPVQPIDDAALFDLEPALGKVSAAYWLPETAFVDPRAYVEALGIHLVDRGVRFISGAHLLQLSRSGGRVVAAKTSAGELTARTVVIATGAWTGLLASVLGRAIPMRPLRGQIALLRRVPSPIRRVLTAGSRYLVPRAGGRVLIGSTSEEAGFEERTTVDGIASLLAFAARVHPGLQDAELEASWAGLRPMTPDELPIIDEIEPGLVIAAGHGRFGVALAPSTGAMVASLAAGETPEIPLGDFRLDRFARGAA